MCRVDAKRLCFALLYGVPICEDGFVLTVWEFNIKIWDDTGPLCVDDEPGNDMNGRSGLCVLFLRTVPNKGRIILK
jgi:hypothetical protein